MIGGLCYVWTWPILLKNSATGLCSQYPVAREFAGASMIERTRCRGIGVSG
jgi:hypothetical protein